MKEERKKVLDMLEQGKVSPEEAAKLLDCLEENEEKQSMRVQTDAARMKGKKLRVEVNGFVEGGKKINVNVSVPLVLARYADNILNNCVPKDLLIKVK